MKYARRKAASQQQSNGDENAPLAPSHAESVPPLPVQPRVSRRRSTHSVENSHTMLSVSMTMNTSNATDSTIELHNNNNNSTELPQVGARVTDKQIYERQTRIRHQLASSSLPPHHHYPPPAPHLPSNIIAGNAPPMLLPLPPPPHVPVRIHVSHKPTVEDISRVYNPYPIQNEYERFVKNGFLFEPVVDAYNNNGSKNQPAPTTTISREITPAVVQSGLKKLAKNKMSIGLHPSSSVKQQHQHGGGAHHNPAFQAKYEDEYDLANKFTANATAAAVSAANSRRPSEHQHKSEHMETIIDSISKELKRMKSAYNDNDGDDLE